MWAVADAAARDLDDTERKRVRKEATGAEIQSAIDALNGLCTLPLKGEVIQSAAGGLAWLLVLSDLPKMVREKASAISSQHSSSSSSSLAGAPGERKVGAAPAAVVPPGSQKRKADQGVGGDPNRARLTGQPTGAAGSGQTPPSSAEGEVRPFIVDV
jgi:hypothetical protein